MFGIEPNKNQGLIVAFWLDWHGLTKKYKTSGTDQPKKHIPEKIGINQQQIKFWLPQLVI